MGNGSPLFLFGKNESEKVFEFSESPFNSEHLKYSRVMSFIYNNEEHKVGDFIIAKTNDDVIYQIKAIGYKKMENFHPELWFTASVFMHACSFYKDHSYVEITSAPTSNEFIKTTENTMLQPKHIKKRVDLYPYLSDKEINEDISYCRYEFCDSRLREYKPLQPRFCDEFIEEGN